MEAIAKHNFNATAEDELSFEKDDVLKIVNQDDDENWYKAELNGKAGLVPSNYISMKPHSWFVANVNREKAEDYLKKYPQPDGAFLVRKSETSPGDFSISVRFADTVQHYKILRDREGKFFLWVVKFNSINELIEYHRQASVSRTQTVVLKDMINSNEAGHGDVHQHQPKGQVNMHVQQVQQQHVPHVQRVRAVYDFTPQQADEIELRKGDMVEVLAMEDQNWWKGICNGKEGMFPATYVLKET